MSSIKGDEFLLLCKHNFENQISPIKSLNDHTEQSKRLRAIAKIYFTEGRQEEFAGFFQEGQYGIQLFAAHFLMEFGWANENLKIKALDIISSYSGNILTPDLAEEERLWLLEYRNRLH